MKRLSASLIVAAVVLASAVPAAQPGQAVEVARVSASPGSSGRVLRGELRAQQEVDLHARVAGFVERVLVDRGSSVTAGQLLAVLSAPELDARVAEAAATRDLGQARLAEARARLATLESAEARLAEAAQTEGVVSGQELVQSREGTRAARAAVAAAEAAVAASVAAAEAARRTRGYLELRAPFAGMITERLAHPGALAGPGTSPLLRLAQVTRLRLVVAVPEAQVSSVERGRRVSFTTAAHAGVTFAGRIARDAGTLDPASRTMAVEADVANEDGRLAPGMYADVAWPGTPASSHLRVPATAVVRTTQRVFVIRVRDGKAEWVDVRILAREGDHMDVVGGVAVGDQIVRRGSDEVREGAWLTTKVP